MASLSSFGVSDMMALRAQLRALFDEAEPATFEEAATRLAGLFYATLTDDRGEPACALLRIYKTHPLDDLDHGLREFAASLSPPDQPPHPESRCLVLAATAGCEPAWNSRHRSKGHRAIPLISEAAVEAAPMVFRMMQQFGVEVARVIRPVPQPLLEPVDQVRPVFYVAEALGSPHIPAQETFVIPYGVRSVLGFGGMLTSGDLVAAILFSRVPIAPGVADLFKVIGLNFKLALLPWVRKPLFSVPAGETS